MQVALPLHGQEGCQGWWLVDTAALLTFKALLSRLPVTPQASVAMLTQHSPGQCQGIGLIRSLCQKMLATKDCLQSQSVLLAMSGAAGLLFTWKQS